MSYFFLLLGKGINVGRGICVFFLMFLGVLFSDFYFVSDDF